MKASVYNLKGESVGEVDLPDNIFAVKWNPDLVHQALRAQMANARKPWAHAKGRSEVRGGGRKPWKQKHTGRARHGSIRSPIWKGGGATHGPIKEKDYSLKINKKMLRGAIHSLLSKKVADQELKIIDSLKLNSHKTKALSQSIKNVVKDASVLLVPAKGNREIFLASGNIPKVKSLAANSLNVRALLTYKNILLDQGALVEIR